MPRHPFDVVARVDEQVDARRERARIAAGQRHAEAPFPAAPPPPLSRDVDAPEGDVVPESTRRRRRPRVVYDIELTRQGWRIPGPLDVACPRFAFLGEPELAALEVAIHEARARAAASASETSAAEGTV